MQRLLVILAGLLAVSLTSCGVDGTPDPADDAFCGSLLQQLENLDAIDVLKNPAARLPTGGTTHEEALALCLRFQELGTERIIAFVEAPLKNVPYDSSFGYALGVVIQLPTDLKQRTAIFRLYAKNHRNVGYTPRADTGQKYLYIRWAGRKASSIL